MTLGGQVVSNRLHMSALLLQQEEMVLFTVDYCLHMSVWCTLGCSLNRWKTKGMEKNIFTAHHSYWITLLLCSKFKEREDQRRVKWWPLAVETTKDVKDKVSQKSLLIFLHIFVTFSQVCALFTLCFQADHRIHVLISLVSIDMFSIHKSASETTNGFSLWELSDLTTRVLFPLSLAWLSSPVPCFP